MGKMLFGKRKKKAKDEVGRLAAKIANENSRSMSQDEEQALNRQDPVLTLDKPLVEEARVQETPAQKTSSTSEQQLPDQQPHASPVNEEEDEPESRKRGWGRRKSRTVKAGKKSKAEIAVEASQVSADLSVDPSDHENTDAGVPDKPRRPAPAIPIAERLRPVTGGVELTSVENLVPPAVELSLPEQSPSPRSTTFEREMSPIAEGAEETSDLEAAILAEFANDEPADLVDEEPADLVEDETVEVQRQVASIFRSRTKETTYDDPVEEDVRLEAAIEDVPAEQIDEFVPVAPRRLPMAPPRSGEGVTRLVFPAKWCGAWIAEGGETIYIHVEEAGRCRIYALQQPDGDFYGSTTFSELQTEAMIADFVREPIEGMSGERMVIQTAPGLTSINDGPEVHFYFLVPDSEDPDAGNRFALPKDPVNSAFMVTGQDNMDLNPWGAEDEINWIADSGTYYKAPEKVDAFLANRLMTK